MRKEEILAAEVTTAAETTVVGMEETNQILSRSLNLSLNPEQSLVLILD
jgi:hypothetical protein